MDIASNMWLLCLRIFIGVFWILSLVHDVTGQQASRRYAGVVRRPTTVTQCALPYFPNGEAKIRNRGRMIRFECATGYSIIGSRYTSCNNGRWDTSIPVCVKPGCTTLANVESGYILYEMNKSTAWLSCFEENELAGSKNTYCNGTHWDRPLGVCRRTGQETALACDFETETMCGWTNDVLHDFDWKRSDGTLNPRALRTGPKYDHTKMEPKAGHFMIVDSAEQFTNDTARLISPIFEPELSIGACFQFFYHMYGETVGLLKLYVKPINSDLYDLTPSFMLEGNQKNVWHEGHIDIPQQSERFQIVFQASLGMRYKSDIAIDDVSLMQGDSCKVPVEDGLDIPEPVLTDPVKIESCENRCGVHMADLLNSTDTIVHCDCHEDCVINATCCPDFRERCVFEVLLSVNTSTSTRIPVTTPTATITTTTKHVATSSTPEPSTATATTVRTTSTTTRVVISTPTATLKPTTTPRVLPSSSSITSTTKVYNLRPRPFVPMTNQPRLPRLTTTKATITTAARPTTPSTTTRASTATVAIRSSSTVPTQSDMISENTDFEDTTDELATAGLVFMPSPPEIVKKSGLSKFFICAAAGLVILAGIVYVAYHYARMSRSGVLNRLKDKSQKKYFEDIRFLAGDDDLNFNISEGEDVVEEGKNTRKQASENSKNIEQTESQKPVAGGRKLEDISTDEGLKTSEEHVIDPQCEHGDVDADYDSENESTYKAGEHAAGTNGRSTKKVYQKYAKYFDEDMTSTLL